MKIDSEALRERATAIYSEFTAGQKVMVVLATIGLVFGGMTLARWSAEPNMAPLYSGLTGSDAAEVTDALDSMGISYQLADGGQTIMVPRDDVYEARIELSSQNLPSSGGEGWGIIDDQSFTTSDFEQQIGLQRAMEGELARTIASFDAVRTANVHLVMPEVDLFSDDDVKPTASVLIDTGDGSAIGSSQVQAIVHLVSSSVKGLTPAEVTLTDTTGRVLSASGVDGIDIAAGDQRMAQKLAYEAAIARSIQTGLLDPIAGIGRSRVVVSADLDFDTKESLTQSYGEPDTAPVAAENTTSETYINSDGEIVGGVLGPDAVPVTDGEESSSYVREDVNREFLVDSVTESVTSAPGAVQGLSIAVLVDEAVGINTATVSEMVAAAAGLKPARGDVINVQAIAFSEVEDLEPVGTGSEAGDDMVLTLARVGGTILLVLIVVLLAYRSARKSALARYPVAIPLPSAAEETQALLDELDEELAAVGAGGEPAEALPPAEPSRHQLLHDQIGELIDRQPDDVAAVLRTWLADRRN